MMSYLEGVRLDYETASLITRLTLIDSLKAINIDIAALEKKESLQDYMKEDLEYDQKYREALLVVIGNFSTKDEMTKVLKECNEN
jgi:bacterioferritin (cytochrome b1)